MYEILVRTLSCTLQHSLTYSRNHNIEDKATEFSYEEIAEVAAFIKSKTAIRPKLGIICGSGLGGLADDLDRDLPKDVVPYKTIPKFPQTTGTYMQGCN